MFYYLNLHMRLFHNLDESKQIFHIFLVVIVLSDIKEEIYRSLYEVASFGSLTYINSCYATIKIQLHYIVHIKTNVNILISILNFISRLLGPQALSENFSKHVFVCNVETKTSKYATYYTMQIQKYMHINIHIYTMAYKLFYGKIEEKFF